MANSQNKRVYGLRPSINMQTELIRVQKTPRRLWLHRREKSHWPIFMGKPMFREITYYVYISFRRETLQFYIGRKTIRWIHPNSDIDYFGSGQWISYAKQHKIKLEKEILKICSSLEEAKRIEKKLLVACQFNKFCMNIEHRPRNHPSYPKLMVGKFKLPLEGAGHA